MKELIDTLRARLRHRMGRPDYCVMLSGDEAQLIVDHFAARPEPTELERTLRERARVLLKQADEHWFHTTADTLLQAADALAAQREELTDLRARHGEIVDAAFLGRDALKETMQRVAQEMLEQDYATPEELALWARALGGGGE